jgi:peptide/nickel transport system substrate-binding protein
MKATIWAKKGWICLLLSMAITLSLPVPASAAKPGGTLKVAIYADATTLDPGGANDSASQKAYNLIFDCLLTFNKEMQVIPHVATAFVPSKKNKVWTFTIRKGIKFHDGSELTADDVAFSFQRILDAPEAESQKRSSLAMIDNISTKGDQVIFNLKYPFAPFPGTTALVQIVPKKTAKAVGNKEFAVRPIGSGPFKLQEWIRDDHITLIRNDEYWLKKPNLEKVILRPIPEGTVRAMSLLTGEVDVVGQVSNETVGKLESAKNVHLLSTPGVNYYWLGFRQYGPPYNNLKFRKMVYHSIDMDQAIKTVFSRGNGTRAYSAVPPQIWPDDRQYLKAHSIKQDKLKAKQLFKELIAEGVMQKDTKVLVAMLKDPERIKLAEILVTNLKEIGVNAVLQIKETGAYIRSLAKGKEPMIYALGTTPKYLDPDASFSWLFMTGPEGSTHGAKILGLADLVPRINESILKARTLEDNAQRSKLYLDLQRYVLLEQIYHIPAFHKNIVMGKRKNVHDLHPAPNSLLWIVTHFSNVWVD